jgi:hypothetical protein
MRLGYTNAVLGLGVLSRAVLTSRLSLKSRTGIRKDRGLGRGFPETKLFAIGNGCLHLEERADETLGHTSRTYLPRTYYYGRIGAGIAIAVEPVVKTNFRQLAGTQPQVSDVS